MYLFLIVDQSLQQVASSASRRVLVPFEKYGYPKNAQKKFFKFLMHILCKYIM